MSDLIEQLKELEAALEAGEFDVAPETLTQGSALQVKDLMPTYGSLFNEAAKKALEIPISSTYEHSDDPNLRTQCVFLSAVVPANNLDVRGEAVAELIESVNALADKGWLKGTLAPLSELELIRPQLDEATGHSYEVYDLNRKCVTCGEKVPRTLSLMGFDKKLPGPCPKTIEFTPMNAVFVFVHVPVDVYNQATTMSRLSTSEGQIGGPYAPRLVTQHQRG